MLRSTWGFLDPPKSSKWICSWKLNGSCKTNQHPGMGIEAVRSLWWGRISRKIWPNMFPSRWKLEARKSIGQNQNRLQNPQNAAWRKGSNRRHEDRSWPISVFCEWEPVRVSSATVAATVNAYVYIYIYTPQIVCVYHTLYSTCMFVEKAWENCKSCKLAHVERDLKERHVCIPPWQETSWVLQKSCMTHCITSTTNFGSQATGLHCMLLVWLLYSTIGSKDPVLRFLDLYCEKLQHISPRIPIRLFTRCKHSHDPAPMHPGPGQECMSPSWL